MPRKKQTSDEVLNELTSDTSIHEEIPMPEKPKPLFKKVGDEVFMTHPILGPMIVNPKPATGPERRLYQTAPNLKEWLTREQASKKGFPWT